MIDTLPIAHYILMLFELLSIFTQLPFGFIPISCNNNSLASFLRTIRHTWHLDCLPWSVMQRQPPWTEGKKNDSPVEKAYGKQERWQQLLNFQIVVFFAEPFFNVLLFVGLEDFQKYQMAADVFLMAFSKPWKFVPLRLWGATGILTTHDPGAQDPDWWIRAGRVKMVGDGNPWRFEIRLLWMRKLGVFVSKTFWCWSL